MELESTNNCLQKEFENFKTTENSKNEIAENNSLVKTDLILKELEIEIENLKKLESESRKYFDSEMAESQTKINLLKNENFVLKSDFERCKITKIRCSDLLKENSDLKTEIQQLETILAKFSNGEKSNSR